MKAISLACVVLSAGVLVAWLPAQEPAYDLIIRNGRVLDGSGNPWYRADVGVRGDTIARIALSITAPATRIVAAGGPIVAPGFLALHNHARDYVFELPSAEHYGRHG